MIKTNGTHYKSDSEGRYVRKRGHTLNDACKEIAAQTGGVVQFLSPNFGVVRGDGGCEIHVWMK